MRERWKWAPGFEGFYLVSDRGRVMSVPHNPIAGPSCGRMLKAHLCGSGYEKVDLTVAGAKRQVMVHRLVAEAFIPNPHGKPQVNHIDGDKTNNAVENLEWATQSENMLHAYANLPRKAYDHCHSVKLTAEEAREIREEQGTATEIAKRHGISDVMVLKIKKRECWRNA